MRFLITDEAVIERDRLAKKEWHKHFAWRPVKVRVNAEFEIYAWAWLETVERRNLSDFSERWEYRAYDAPVVESELWY